MDVTYRSVFDLLLDFVRVLQQAHRPCEPPFLPLLASLVPLFPLSLCAELRILWHSLQSKLSRQLCGAFTLHEVCHLYKILMSLYDRERDRCAIAEQLPLQLELALDNHATLGALITGHGVEKKLAHLFACLFPGSALATTLSPQRFLGLCNFLPLLDANADDVMLVILERLVDELMSQIHQPPLLNKRIRDGNSGSGSDDDNDEAPLKKRARLEAPIDAIPLGKDLKFSTSHTSKYQNMACRAPEIHSVAALAQKRRELGPRPLFVDYSAHTNTYACARIESIDEEMVSVVDPIDGSQRTHLFDTMRWRECAHTQHRIVLEYDHERRRRRSR